MSKIIKILMCLTVLFTFVACNITGKVVPPGTTVIVLKAKGAPIIKHEGVYKAWGRDKVYFVDTKLRAFPKGIKVLCKDDINMNINLKWLGSFKVTPQSIDVIKKKVPSSPINTGDKKGFELSLQNFFNTAMSDILSSVGRTVISPYVTDSIRENREAIRVAIKKLFLDRLSKLNYPVETADVLLTNIDYPEEITAKRQRIKDAELQDLENAAVAKANVAKAKRDAELAAEQGKAQLVRAKADAAANTIRAKSLTPEILAVKQLETLVKLAEGPNNTVVVIPFDAIRPGGMQDMLINREAIERLTNKIGE